LEGDAISGERSMMPAVILGLLCRHRLGERGPLNLKRAPRSSFFLRSEVVDVNFDEKSWIRYFASQLT
jgi:hypothetical protein